MIAPVLNLVTSTPDSETIKAQLLEYLYTVVNKVKENDVIGFIILMNHPKGISYIRKNISSDSALGMLSHVEYSMHKEWDNAK